MRNKIVLFFILTLASCILTLSHAATTIDPSRTVYLGKTLGMGGAHIGLSDDGEGIFSNPSGLAHIKFPQVTGLSRKIFLDQTSYSIYSFAMPTDIGIFGIGHVGTFINGSYATLRDENNRISINPSVEAMSYNNKVTMLSYSRDLSTIPSLSRFPILFGANLKYFEQILTGGGIGKTGTAYNLDLSATYKASSWLTFGGNLQNILGGSINWGNSQDKIGGFYKFGCAVNLLGDKANSLYQSSQKVVGAIDIDLPHDVLAGSTLLHGGLEWAPLNYLAIRGGINQQLMGTALTMGLGFLADGFRFDYAYCANPNVTGDNPHYFSLSYTGARIVEVDKKLKKKVNAITFLSPKDRFITSEEVIPVTAEALYADVLDQKTIWTVPVFSSTNETHEIKDYKKLVKVYFDGQEIQQTGTIEAKSWPMNYGRHALVLTGFTTPDAIQISSEIKVLRFEPFYDTPMTYWAIEPVALTSVLGLLKGYPDMSFKPEKGITRAELTSLLVRTLDISAEAWIEASSDKKFKDIKDTNWALPYINIGSELGIVSGYPDKTFKPNKVLTRAEGIVILARFAKLPEKDFVSFPDLKEGFWANKHITAAKEVGMLRYLEGKSFEHKKNFSRAEAAEVLYRSVPIQKIVNQYWETGFIPGEVKQTVTPEAIPVKPTTIEATATHEAR